VSGTFTGVYVDEYQDCTVRHHTIVKRLADFLPCRAVGDDLQGIFGFANDPLADWNGDVLGYFTLVGELTTPHRWAKTNPALGEWLKGVRQCLKSGKEVDLDGYWEQLPDGKYAVPCQIGECKKALALDGRVVVVRKWDREVYAIGKKLKGVYGCMEEVECRDLLEVCRKLDEATPGQRPAVILDFVGKCVTAVPAVVKTLLACAEARKAPSAKTASNNPRLCDSLAAVAGQDSPTAMAAILDEIASMPDANLYRKELFFELRKVAINHKPEEDVYLQATAWRIRESARRAGRRLPRRLVSRTVLIKGLEFDHVLLPNVDDFDGAKDLYVALTRASKSLLVLSRSRRITRPTPVATG
jgi:DNA helicase-2/ATP-dependent DNA helicase PcrA